MFWRRTKKSSSIPLLARIWQEDNVWNISAFDLPVVVFGDSLDEARHNFGEALQSHFEALRMTGEFDAEAHRLIRLAKEYDPPDRLFGPSIIGAVRVQDWTRGRIDRSGLPYAERSS